MLGECCYSVNSLLLSWKFKIENLTAFLAVKSVNKNSLLSSLRSFTDIVDKLSLPYSDKKSFWVEERTDWLPRAVLLL
jgi:hypothetical protein